MKGTTEIEGTKSVQPFATAKMSLVFAVFGSCHDLAASPPERFAKQSRIAAIIGLRQSASQSIVAPHRSG